MSRFSIIVPSSKNQAAFEDTLASVLRYRPEDSQVIVVHDGEYQDPYNLSGEVKMLMADGNQLVNQLNIGLCYAAGEITVLVRAGIELDENWQDEIDIAFQERNVGSVSPTIVNRSKPNVAVCSGVGFDKSWSRRLIGKGCRLASRRTRSLNVFGPSSWLAAFRTSVLKSIAPLDESLDDAFMDLDLAFALRELGFRNSACSRFIGYVDSERAIVDSFQQPHGLSSQRAVQRFGNPGLGQIIRFSIRDVLQSPLVTWKFKHGLQRLGTGKYQAEDLAFARKLQRLKLEKPWVESAIESESPFELAELRRAA